MPLNDDFVPQWATRAIRAHHPEFALDGRVPLLEIEVLEPGVVRIDGVWSADDHFIVITPTKISFLSPGNHAPVSMTVKEGEQASFFHDAETIDQKVLFAFGDSSQPGWLTVPTLPHKTGRNDLCWCLSRKKFKKCHGA